jgi:hypothetical protein
MWPARRSSIRNWISEMGFMVGPWLAESAHCRIRQPAGAHSWAMFLVCGKSIAHEWAPAQKEAIAHAC